MNDAKKAGVIQYGSMMPCFILVLITMMFFLRPVYSPPFPIFVWSFLAILSILIMALPLFHPRVKHYWKLGGEFDRNYRYEKEVS